MPSLTIRDIPDEITDALANLAGNRGQSREQFLRDLLKAAAEPNALRFFDVKIAQQVQSRIELYERLLLEEQIKQIQEQIEEDLGRYYLMLGETLRAMRFTREEAMMMCDICKEAAVFRHSINTLSAAPLILYANLRDGILLDQINEKWKVDGEAFLERVQRFTPLEAMAILDAIERFWIQSKVWLEPDFNQLLIQVGLVRVDRSPLQP